jgi:5-methylcytosine-specific restriction enzyme subunit McrC
VTTLNEYETREIPLDTDSAFGLLAFGDDKLRVRRSRPGHWTISATQHVGTFVSGNAHIVVRPKVKAAQLLDLLVFSTRRMGFRRDLFSYHDTQDVAAAAVAIFARLAEQTFVTGLDTSYLPRRETLVAVRGRLDLPAMASRGGIHTPLPCRFEELSVDTPRNRLVLLAARTARRIGHLPLPVHHQVGSVVRALDGVSDDRNADLERLPPPTRLNAHYAPLMELAALLCKGASIKAEPGGQGASSFTIDMNQVFEDIITDGLRRHLPRPYDVRGQRLSHLGEKRKVAMYPDIVIEDRRRQHRYVVDAKYKLSRHGTARNADLYQMLAYTTALGLPEGLLVYCTHDAAAPDREVVVANSRKRLRSRPLPLSGDHNVLDAGLRELAAEITVRMEKPR